MKCTSWIQNIIKVIYIRDSVVEAQLARSRDRSAGYFRRSTRLELGSVTRHTGPG